MKENSQRKNRFVDSYNERLNEARDNLESVKFETLSFSVNDLMDFLICNMILYCWKRGD